MSQAIADKASRHPTITFDPTVFTTAAEVGRSVSASTLVTAARCQLCRNPYGQTQAFIRKWQSSDNTVSARSMVAKPGLTINGGELPNGWFVVAGAASSTLDNLTVTGGLAEGCRRRRFVCVLGRRRRAGPDGRGRAR